MQTISRVLIRQILTDAIDFFIQNIRQIATLCLPLLFAATIVNFGLARAYYGTPQAIFAPFVFNILIYPLYSAALIQLMANEASRVPSTNSALMVMALQRWVPFLVLKTIMVILIGVGMTLLILPGVFFAVRLAFAEFYLVLFGLNPKEALQKSFVATRSHFGLILILLLLTYVPVLFSGLIIDQLVYTVTQNDFFRIIANTVWAFIGLFVHVVLFRVFMEVGSQKDEA